ncbi:unnamed protein product [Cochlearia groenlandica]
MNLFIRLEEYEGRFDMEKAVCNHGFFMMDPNIWNPKRKSLSRPLTISNSSSVNVTISHPKPHPFLVVQVHGIDNVSRIDEELISQQVNRMLRISTDDERVITDFQKLHEPANTYGFGRIFRSPNLFEDMVKSILLCYCNWERTLSMASQLCLLQLKLANGTIRPRGSSKKRKRIPDKEITRGNFPSAKEIVTLGKDLIKEHCKLGYRADLIILLAHEVESGWLNLEKMEKMEVKKLTTKLNKIQGFGPFVTSTVLMCIGYYHLVPSDTETLRLLKQEHGMVECSKGTIKKVAQSFYDKFSPFQSLAYWFDLIQNYEKQHGKLSELSKDDYKSVGGCSHKK